MTTSIAQRQAAAEKAFREQGWPTRALEAWKTSPTKDIVAFGEGELSDPSAPMLELAKVELERLGEVQGPRLVLVGGYFQPTLSTLKGLSIAPTEADEALGALARLEGAPLVALSARALSNALVIRASEAADTPVEVVHLGTPGAGGSHARILASAGTSERLTIVEHFVGLSGDPSWTNSVTEVVVGANAHVCHVQILRGDASQHRTANLTAEVSRDGRFTSHVVALGGKLGRSEVQVRLTGQGSSCDLNGLYVAGGSSVLDNYTEIEHLAPHTTSAEEYRGVMSERSTGGFVGRVLIHEGAVKSETHQLNNNLLLSNTAVVHTRPQLEIDNDDVIATHGSTVGQLDEDALFYLRSRGLGAEQARALMISAFAKTLLDRLPIEGLRDLCAGEVANSLEVERAWMGELA